MFICLSFIHLVPFTFCQHPHYRLFASQVATCMILNHFNQLYSPCNNRSKLSSSWRKHRFGPPGAPSSFLIRRPEKLFTSSFHSGWDKGGFLWFSKWQISGYRRVPGWIFQALLGVAWRVSNKYNPIFLLLKFHV